MALFISIYIKKIKHINVTIPDVFQRIVTIITLTWCGVYFLCRDDNVSREKGFPSVDFIFGYTESIFIKILYARDKDDSTYLCWIE